MDQKFKNSLRWVIPILIVGGIILFFPEIFSIQDEDTFYVEHVKPIINKKCISCHGGVKQSAGFSMMNRASFFLKNESGKPAINLESPSLSELLLRINHKDPSERMPSEGKPLSAEEINVFEKWVEMGAPWGEHWAYKALKPVNVPSTSGWMGLLGGNKEKENAIDAFIKQKLNKNNLKLNPAADKETLLRRVSLDLIGMPAPKRFADKFLKSNHPNAYKNLVDSLLSMPQFGEKWASVWLDIARYADSKGYEKDGSRQIWRYRDWVIQALNKDMPYNQFLTEQLAGDLLPNPTENHYIATAFHRNTPTNDEGGTDDEEFRTAAVIDRVNTTFEGLMSTTFACTQCHGHPYEDIKHDEYFQFMAFFNNSRDEDTVEEFPIIRHYEKEDSLALLQLKSWVKKVSTPQRANEIYTFLKFLQPLVYATHADNFVNSELYDTKYLVFRKNSSARIKDVLLNGETRFIAQQRGHSKSGKLTIHLDSLKGKIIGKINIPSTEGKWAFTSFDLTPAYGRHDLYFRYENKSLTSDMESGFTLNSFHLDQKFPGQTEDPIRDKMDSVYWALLSKNPPYTPIMMDNSPQNARKTQVFIRGNWKVKGEEVLAGIPKVYGKNHKLKYPNRLGLVKWMTDKENPLVSRTLTNRLWEQLFGVGIVETLEDFGSQGTLPSHPELLDYLAWEFMNKHKWSIKSSLSEIILSATYCQSSVVDPEKLKKDPNNRLLSRAPRIRLSAEQIRDQALSLAGLLSARMYGPSVMPYQPDGIWASPYDGNKWKISEGEDKYRRSIYTYYKRSSPYPSQLTFDGTGRNVCTARRIRTNTPLQALVTLNDPVFMEAATHFAQKILNPADLSVNKRIELGYKLLLNKEISPAKLQPLVKLYKDAYSYYKVHPELVKEIQISNPAVEDAAYTLVANALLNLDEVITKN
ncbi:MAG: hypothetical protein RLZZ417_11 [Bacteroidota bacterium]|jgi:hypothetical protein